MDKIWRIFLYDLRHASCNVIAGIVCVGLVIVPSLYAWINIAGSWDPYGNTHNLKVAVANTDEGFSSSLMPLSINVGDKVCDALRANDQIGWVITDEADARDGVDSGRYYAAIIVPKEFSRDLLGMLDPSTPRAKLIYLDNQKENAIASIVTDKATTAVQTQIDETFAETVSEVGASTISGISDYLSGDQVADLATRLDEALVRARGSLTDTATGLRGYGALVGSAQTLVGATSALDGSGDPDAIPQALDSAASGLTHGGDGLTQAIDAIHDSLEKGSGSLDSMASKLDDAFDKAGTTTNAAADTLDELAGDAQERAGRLQAVNQAFSDQEAALTRLRDQLANSGTALPQGVMASVERALARTQQAVTDSQQAADAMAELVDGFGQTASDLRQGVSDANGARDKLKGQVAEAKSKISAVASDYDGTVADDLHNLSSTVSGLTGDARTIISGLDSTLDTVKGVADQATGDLGQVKTQLDKGADDLEAASGRLQDLHDRISRALGSGDMDTVRTILSGNPEELARFLSAPVELHREPIFPVANNGSAMAPFYSTLALFVGAIILVAMLKVSPSEAELAAVGGAKPYQVYLGRLGIFLVLGLLQATLLVSGDLFYLHIQCVNPWLMVLAAWATSFVFCNITYALTVSFGDVGKAIAVFLLVIQVAGSGGSFPIQMLPAPFQALYPFLPFVPAITCMRGAVAGVYGMDYLMAMGQLMAFLVPCLLLGLLLRKPVVKLNHWIEHQLESTRIM